MKNRSNPSWARWPDAGPMLAGLCILSACELDEVSFFDLPAPESVGVEVVLIAAERDVADALGWPDGMVPGASARLASVGAEEAWEVDGASGDDGRIDFGAVRPGTYRLEIRRALTESERSVPGAAGVFGFMDDLDLIVGREPVERAVELPASRPGSLVFSEIKQGADELASGFGGYPHGTYFELYNNSDTVIHLDGKILGQGFRDLLDFSPPRPCDGQSHMRLDPLGIWTIQFERFPGSGTDHPLAPGETVVVALDAIDHSPFAPTAPDLSNADFESIGTADVDNPAVPNMINLGRIHLPRGFRMLSGIAFVADPVDPETLDRAQDLGGQEYQRIPTDRILDVVTFMPDWEEPNFPRCPEIVHPAFDRRWFTFFISSGYTHRSLHRRPLARLPDGRVILQRTRSSHADFFEGAYLTGSVPEPD